MLYVSESDYAMTRERRRLQEERNKALAKVKDEARRLGYRLVKLIDA